MKILWLALGALCIGFASCQKNSNTATSAIPVCGTGTSPALFVPHIDTFSGTFLVKIGDGGYTDSTSKVTDVFVNHFDSTHFTLSGNGVTTTYFDDAHGTATFGPCTVGDSISVDSANAYYFHPSSHRYEGYLFCADSLYINISSQPGSCLFTQLQTFAGKKH